MSNKNYTVVLIIILFISCSESKPKIVYDEDGELEKSGSQVIIPTYPIADLPLRIDSLSYLIHPIGEKTSFKGYNKITGSLGSKTYTNFQISSLRNDEISGQMTNLLFQSIEDGRRKLLTDKSLKILTVTYLRDIADQLGKKILLYEVIDADTNKDQVLDYNDIYSLYMSGEDGGNFRKISYDGYGVLGWTTVPERNELYFRSISDSNKNGLFDKEDNVIYQFIDLRANEDLKVNYDPLN